MKKSLLLGILASFFFAFTFLLNRSMNLSGGYWLWSACLRYLFMLPMLGIILYRNNGIMITIREIKKNIWGWLLWSTVGFGLFYAPLTLSSVFGSSWLAAASWQITIVAGVLLTPLFGQKIPIKNLTMSLVILAGVFLLQAGQMKSLKPSQLLLSMIPMLIAAFSYPLGNRKMMNLCQNHVTTLQRVFGMTLCSMPFWILLSIFSYSKVGLPESNQVVQSVVVALFSGVIATILFFKATDLVKTNTKHLALIEATQSGEVLFTLLGGIFILGDSLPSTTGFLGIAFILIGMVLNSLVSSNKS